MLNLSPHGKSNTRKVKRNTMDTEERMRQNPFTVPEGYMETLENEVRKKTVLREEDAGTWSRYLKPALAMACSFALVFLLAYGAMSLTGRHDNDSYDYMSYSGYSLMHMYFNSEEDTTATEAASEDDILEYLMNGDVTTLYLAAYESEAH